MTFVIRFNDLRPWESHSSFRYVEGVLFIKGTRHYGAPNITKPAGVTDNTAHIRDRGMAD
ncbi:MAG: hypothetical protein AAFR31_11430 [Cyanobacteria bacterium J06627_8]